MPSLKAVRKRIASTKSTQKITRAMKLVAAAKLRRAQDAIIAARPYANSLAEAVAEVASRAGDGAHPMLVQRPVEKITLVVLTSDRGLCGGFNANACRTAQRFVDEKKQAAVNEIAIDVLGRKGREFFRRRRFNIAHEFGGAAGDTAADRAREVAFSVTDDFTSGRADAVYVVFNEFKSAVSQRVVTQQLLPVAPQLTKTATETLGPTDFLYEPSKTDLLSILLPLYVENQLFRAILESIASEFGARMSAMESATKNAKEMISRLTLEYNRARQAAITKELMEIVGGAEALKG